MKIISDERKTELLDRWCKDFAPTGINTDSDCTKMIATALVDRAAQAQLDADHESIYEWGNEPCPHGDKEVDDFNKANIGVAIARNDYLRRECPLCWEELK